MIVVNDINKDTLCIFSILFLTVTVASAFAVDELMPGNDELPGIWKRSNAELVNLLNGMNLNKLVKAGKRSMPSSVIMNHDNIDSVPRFQKNMEQLLYRRPF